MFELHNGGECRSGFATKDVYKRSKRSDGCFNGGGSHVSSQVYYLKENGNYNFYSLIDYIGVEY